MNYSTAGDVIDSVLTYVIMTFAPIIVIVFAYALNKYSKGSSDSKGLEPMLESLRVSGGAIATYWNILVLCRWIFTIAVIVFLRDYNAFQIILLLTSSLMIQMLIIHG